ncbi:hypothetical protein ACLMAB_19720 [Brevibacillus laterosporus]
MSNINHKSNEAFTNRDFTARRRYDDIAVFIHNYEQQIDQLLSSLGVDSVDLVTEDEDTNEEDEKRKYLIMLTTLWTLT